MVNEWEGGRELGEGGREGEGGGQICRLSELCDNSDATSVLVRAAAELGVKSWEGDDATSNETGGGGENTNECKGERRDCASLVPLVNSEFPLGVKRDG